MADKSKPPQDPARKTSRPPRVNPLRAAQDALKKTEERSKGLFQGSVEKEKKRVGFTPPSDSKLQGGDNSSQTKKDERIQKYIDDYEGDDNEVDGWFKPPHSRISGLSEPELDPEELDQDTADFIAQANEEFFAKQKAGDRRSIPPKKKKKPPLFAKTQFTAKSRLLPEVVDIPSFQVPEDMGDQIFGSLIEEEKRGLQ